MAPILVIGCDTVYQGLANEMSNVAKKKGIEIVLHESVSTMENSDPSVITGSSIDELIKILDSYSELWEKTALGTDQKPKPTTAEQVFGLFLDEAGLLSSGYLNKYSRNMRCVNPHDNYTAEMGRRHNDAQILCIGAATTGPEIVKEMIERFVSTDFEGGRHAGRIEKIHKSLL